MVQSSRSVAAALVQYDITDPAVAHNLADAYSIYQETLIHVFPDTRSTLDALQARDIRLGLITNGSSQGQRIKLERFQLIPYFEIVLIDQELGFGKPNPRIYLHALDILRLSPRYVWMVGDNLVWDGQAPQSIGIYSVWHDYMQTELPANAPAIPDRIITGIVQLLL